MVSLVCQPWITRDDLPEHIQDETGALDAAVVDATLLVASDQLYALSGRRWQGAGCSRTVTLESDCNGRGEQHTVRLLTGRPAAWPWASRLQLGDYPVTQVTALLDQDGAVIPAEQWRLVNGRDLEALDPATGRPTGWRWTQVTVSYEYGQAPPAGGVAAAAVLAGELLLARAGSTHCRLPDRVQQVTRQGVSIAVLDPLDFLDRGRTGLIEVDTWIAAVNPGRARARPMVWSPDTARTRTRNGG